MAYHLTEGITSVAYGEPRMTQVIDIVLQNEAAAEGHLHFSRALSHSDFMFDRSVMERAVDRKKMFQLLILLRL